jgi:hypothetical protein
MAVSIAWASGVHVDGMASWWGGGGLKVFGAVGDNGAGFLVQAFPAVFLLAGDEEDLLGRAGFAKPGGVEAGNVAEAANGWREQAEVGDVAALVAAAAARFLAEDHDVLGQLPGDGEIEAQPIGAVFDDEGADVAGRKYGAGGDFEGFGEADDGPDGADGLPELLAGERAFLGEPGVAHDLGAGEGPAVVLFMGKRGKGREINAKTRRRSAAKPQGKSNPT